MEKRCNGCMKIKSNSPKCEHCGYDERSKNAKHQLPVGTVVGGQYILGRVLGQGGFGITYIGWDQIMNTPVAVKEYFPSGFAGRDTEMPFFVTSYDSQNSHVFEHNKKRFLREAESLAQMWDVPQIVRVLRHFEENNTAYIAMEYVEGTDLRKYLKQQGKPLDVESTLNILKPIMEALSRVHEADLVHRDISPDNIMVLPDGSAKLLDFGAARYVENPNAEGVLNSSTQAILKHGFAPPEQYQSRGALGPWTDIYAICATIFYCLTGKVPPEAMNRIMEGTQVDWSDIPGLSDRRKAVLEKGMSLQPKDRFSSVEALCTELFREEPEPVLPAARPARQKNRGLLIAAAAVLAAVIGFRFLPAEVDSASSEAEQQVNVGGAAAQGAETTELETFPVEPTETASGVPEPTDSTTADPLTPTASGSQPFSPFPNTPPGDSVPQGTTPGGDSSSGSQGGGGASSGGSTSGTQVGDSSGSQGSSGSSSENGTSGSEESGGASSEEVPATTECPPLPEIDKSDTSLDDVVATMPAGGVLQGSERANTAVGSETEIETDA